MLVHAVFFWVKKDAPATAKKQLAEDCLKYLKTPSVKHLWAGSPAPTPARDVINATYDVGLTVTFDDVAGHDAYQEHPLHKEFIARNKPNLLRVEVYDFQQT